MGKFSMLTKEQNQLSHQSEQNNDQILFQHHPDAILVLDIEGKITSMNGQVTTLLGYSINDFNHSFEKWMDDHTCEKFVHALKKSFYGTSSTFNGELIHVEGNYLPVQLTFIPYQNETTTVFIYCICKDRRPYNNLENEISKLNDKLQQSQKISNIGSYDYDVLKDQAYWSKQSYNILGIKESDFTPTWENVLKFIHPDDLDNYQKTMKNSIKYGEDFELELRIIKRNGEVRTLYLRTNAVIDEHGKTNRLMGTMQDITEAKATKLLIEEREEQIKSVTDRLQVGIWSFDVKTRKYIFYSKAAGEIHEDNPDTLSDNPFEWLKYVHPDDLQLVKNSIHDSEIGKEVFQQFRIIDAKGNLKWLRTEVYPYFNQEGDVIRVDGIVHDITDEKNYTEKLEYVVNHDQLTKLPNRLHFEKQLNKQISISKSNQLPFAVFYLDLDRFKYINDTLGHEIGDQLLISFSQRLNSVIGNNTFLARIGGDEFAVYLHSINKIEDAVLLAKKIILELEKPFYIYDYELYITTSIGISMFPNDGEDSSTLIKNVDIALYKAKESGRNDWQFYSSSMNVEAFKQFQLEKDLRKAITNNEFYLEFQPKVNTLSRKLEGAEALIRWNHPEWGVVSPKEFIPIAEETGYIFKIGDWVVHQVCELLNKWKAQGIPIVPVSVNISAKRIIKADFVQSIKDSIKKWNLDPSLLELELTEYSIIRNTENSEKVISELKEFGIKFALDDFGTGFSSLAYLAELNIDTIKIDKSFVDGIGIHQKNESIIKSIIYLSKELGIKVVAEGAETREQLQYLLQHGCHQIQGYVYSKPVKKEVFSQLMQKGFLKPVPVSLSKKNLAENRRKFYRVNFDYPLCADMTITKIKNKPLTLGSSHSLIEDISLGGLRFLTIINLPVQKNMVLQFTTKLFGREIQFEGNIVWKMEIDDLYQYGIEFCMSEVEQSLLAPILNHLSIQLKDKSLLPDCNFTTDNKKDYLKSATQ